MIRANKRRPTKNGATSIFTGLLECADCGTKLSLRSSKSYLYFRCSKYKGNSRSGVCTQHYIREDALYQLVLKQLQHFLSYLQQFERVFIRQQIDATLAERRYELYAKQKQIEKDEKRMEELDRLFRKIYEESFCQGSVSYKAKSFAIGITEQLLRYSLVNPRLVITNPVSQRRKAVKALATPRLRRP